MWRSNVLKLRRGLSAPKLRCSVRWYSSSLEPVSNAEFLEAFEKVLPREQWSSSNPIGLAISGGVDSMALATLYSSALRTERSFPNCHGLIVDHKARTESTEEAHWVAEQLRSKLNIRSSIIPIKWPEDIDPKDLRRFESEARRLRFQGLGILSKDLGIKDILLAHHGDDQAETVMMRLMKGRWRTGLTGMKAIEGIPECHGMHGIHHSGGDVTNPPYLPFPTEAGGMKILRPLLGFEKSRLIATCNENGINWAEDKTNHDPTYTARNAIRHLLRNHKLPEALSSKSLISLAESMQQRLKSHKEIADDVFNGTPLALDIQTGCLIVRFPLAAAFLDRPIETQKDKHDARNTAFLFLQRVSELVTPKEVPSIGQFSNVIDAIWPVLALDSESSSAESFSVYGTWFRRWDNLSPFTSIDYDFMAKNKMEWLLSRQPLISYERKDGDISLTIPPAPRNPVASEMWHLFDSRFWIKLKNNLSDDDLLVRTLEQKDLDLLSNQARNTSSKEERLKSRNGRFIRAALSLIKPADLRRSIPAIFRKDSSGNESLLCLPTLGASVVDPKTPVEDICQWEVRYKKCDFGTQEVEDVVFPALSFKNIRREVARLDKVQARRGKAKTAAKKTGTGDYQGKPPST